MSVTFGDVMRGSLDFTISKDTGLTVGVVVVGVVGAVVVGVCVGVGCAQPTSVNNKTIAHSDKNNFFKYFTSLVISYQLLVVSN